MPYTDLGPGHTVPRTSPPEAVRADAVRRPVVPGVADQHVVEQQLPQQGGRPQSGARSGPSGLPCWPREPSPAGDGDGDDDDDDDHRRHH
jgi:hypothetical protein